MTTQPSHNFQDIDPRYCTLCGTCVGICPHDTLVIDNERVLQISACKNCGLCYNLCPGRSFDFNQFNNQLFDTKDCDRNIGFYRMIARGYSSDEMIRSNASSGGAVTALLLYLMDKGLIDGAVIVGMSLTEPFKPEVKIVRNREEIIQGSQSKYCLVPVNAIIRKLRNEKGKFAFVGLPCHIHGLRKLQEFKRPESEKIFITIGLFCGFNMSFGGTEFLLKKLGVEKNDIVDLKYRGKGYPGGFFVKTEEKEYFLDKHIYNLINPVFIPKRCLVCNDLTNEFADISVGDIWKKSDGTGWSSIIIRTSLGKEVFTGATQHRYLFHEELQYNDLISSHHHLIQYKKMHVHTRSNILRLNLRLTPSNTSQKYSIRIAGFFYGCLFLILTSSLFRALFSLVPLWLIDCSARLINNRIRRV